MEILAQAELKWIVPQVQSHVFQFSCQILVKFIFWETAATEAETLQNVEENKTCLVYQKTGGSRTVELLRKHVPFARWSYKWGWMEVIKNETRDWSEFPTQPQELCVQATPLTWWHNGCKYCDENDIMLGHLGNLPYLIRSFKALTIHVLADVKFDEMFLPPPPFYGLIFIAEFITSSIG